MKLKCIYVSVYFSKKEKLEGKLESNEIGYLWGWLGPELKEWEDENESEG